MKKAMQIFIKVLVLLCILYSFIGIYIWLGAFLKVDYNYLGTIKQYFGIDGMTTQIWVYHDAMWEAYDAYTFTIISPLDVFLLITGEIFYNKHFNFILYDVMKLIQLFYWLLPCVLLRCFARCKTKKLL